MVIVGVWQLKGIMKIDMIYEINHAVALIHNAGLFRALAKCLTDSMLYMPQSEETSMF